MPAWRRCHRPQASAVCRSSTKRLTPSTGPTAGIPRGRRHCWAAWRALPTRQLSASPPASRLLPWSSRRALPKTTLATAFAKALGTAATVVSPPAASEDPAYLQGSDRQRYLTAVQQPEKIRSGAVAIEPMVSRGRALPRLLGDASGQGPSGVPLSLQSTSSPGTSRCSEGGALGAEISKAPGRAVRKGGPL